MKAREAFFQKGMQPEGKRTKTFSTPENCKTRNDDMARSRKTLDSIGNATKARSNQTRNREPPKALGTADG